MSEKVKVLLLFVVLSFLHAQVFSQSHFVFIQSENKQPFSVQLNNKNYGSSGSGYVIIPQLNAGDYFLLVKSAANQQTLGNYKIVINFNDLGFNLKEDQGSWILENMQSKAIVKNYVPEAAEEKKKVAGDGAGFGDMLSQVLQDPNLNKKKEVKAASNDTAVVQRSDKETIKPSADSAVETEINTSGVIKNSEEEKKEGLNLVFVDFNQRSSDTISIIIPIEGSLATDSTGRIAGQASNPDNILTDAPVKTDSVNIQVAKAASNAASDSVAMKKEAEKMAEEKTETKPAATKQIELKDSVASNTPVADSVNNPFHQPKLTIDSASIPKINTDTRTVDPVVNPNCKGIASADDFIKLRRKMTSQDNDEQMIDAAKKAFRSKCYTTEQIKNLGNLFLNDQSRYAFFDAAYAYVFDPGNYTSLESQLIDDYYKKRFKAMLH